MIVLSYREVETVVDSRKGRPDNLVNHQDTKNKKLRSLRDLCVFVVKLVFFAPWRENIFNVN